MIHSSTRLSLALAFLSWFAGVRSQNCQLQVPENPLTAQGLATPYVLTGCNQFDFANEGAFVEAAILDPATGSIQIYNPLVINAGMTPIGNGTGGATTSTSATSTTGAGAPTSTPTSSSSSSSSSSSGYTNTGTNTAVATGNSSSSSAPLPTATANATAPMTPRQAASAGVFIPPIVPTLPNNAVVGIWFGSNAVTLTLTGATGGCVNGLGTSVFTQFAYCNGPTWFDAAKTAVSQGLIKLPPPGTGSSGQACPTTHDFRIVDQDQSDNVITTYLAINNSTLAQNTPENSKANPDAEVLSNASDNALVTEFIDPALGCAPYQNPCTTCPTGQSGSLATDELVAFFFPPAGGPALVPLNDPMVLVNGQQSLDKVNLYRAGTGQPQADSQNASGLTYCQQFPQSGIFINNNQMQFSTLGSPAPNQATNLFTFLAMRFSASFGPAPGLGCTGLLNVANPVDLTMDGNGIVTAATINTQVLQQILAGGTGNTTSTAPNTTTSTPATTSGSVPAGGTTTMPTTSLPTGSVSVGSTTPPATTSTTTNAGGTGTTPTSSSTTNPAGVLIIPTGSPTSVTSTTPTSSAGLTPTSSPIPSCTGAPTVTVTVTATAPGCQTPATSTPSASPTTTSDSGCGGGQNDQNNQNNQNRRHGRHDRHGGHDWQRSPFDPHPRMRRNLKSRVSSS